MIRDEAAASLDNLFEYLYGEMNLKQEWHDALLLAIATLREPAHEWIRTTDRLPMVEQVVVGLCGGKADIYQTVNVDDFKCYVEYWCALPILPEVEE